MYQKDAQGNKIQVNLKMPKEIQVEKFEMKNTEKPEGSNKILLYIALLFGLIIVGISGYMIVKSQKKERESFGYHLDF
jgi:type IV secretory pathway component VirB8